MEFIHKILKKILKWIDMRAIEKREAKYRI